MEQEDMPETKFIKIPAWGWIPFGALLAIAANIAYFSWEIKEVVEVVKTNQNGIAANAVAISVLSDELKEHRDMGGHPIMEVRAAALEKDQSQINNNIAKIVNDLHDVKGDVKVVKNMMESDRGLHISE